MEHPELRRKVRLILSEEEQPHVDWGRVARLSDELDAELSAEGYTDCPEVVRHYLCDDDIRARDSAYTRFQWEAVRQYVETGEYHDSKPLPRWSCLLMLLVPVAALTWLLL